jgi:hypothetical protein
MKNKLEGNDKYQGVSKDMDLGELRKIIYKSKWKGFIKRDLTTSRIEAMLCRLDDNCEIGTGSFVPIKYILLRIYISLTLKISSRDFGVIRKKLGEG